MDHVHHFSYGPITPVVAYLMSFVGSLLGLRCTARARATGGRSRASWLALASVAIGGTGIWVMHFIAMLGFRVHGAEIRYDVGLTLLSALTAVAIVAIGIFLVGFGGAGPAVVLPAGLITGLGVAAMHYTGMAAMNMSGHVSYEAPVVALSVLIAVVAATAALWFTVRVKGLVATVAAAVIMGVAVSGMHYTGMFAMSVDVHESSGPPDGAQAGQLLMPAILTVSVLAVVLLVIVSVFPGEEEMREMAELERVAQDRGSSGRPVRLTGAPRRPDPSSEPSSDPSSGAPSSEPSKPGSNTWFGG